MIIELPKRLNPLIDTLMQNGIRPVLVGGYLRDILLKNSHSKDIDIELYGLENIQELIKMLTPFANPHEVGKSFGVIKLFFEGYDIDFSLPRTEDKIASGHKGFAIKTYYDIAFEKAALRRDFTINAMGYDCKDKKLLDPFHGQDDLKNRILACVNSKTFIQDPLRLFRALGFCARFSLTCKPELIRLCKSMYANNSLSSLPKERIFEELKKLLLRSQNPSIGLRLLQEMQSLAFFPQLNALGKKQFDKNLIMLDNLAQTVIEDEKLKLHLLFGVLVLGFKTKQEVLDFILSLSEDKKLLSNVSSLYEGYHSLNSFTFCDANIRRLALHVRIEYLHILTSVDTDKSIKKLGEQIYQRSIHLQVSTQPPKALLQGRHLLSLGLQASQKFSELLSEAYEAQLDGEFFTLQEAKEWLKL